MAENILEKLLNLNIVDIALELLPNLNWAEKKRPFWRGQCHTGPTQNRPFYLYTDTNMFNCYACGMQGDPVKLASIILMPDDFHDYIMQRIGINQDRLSPLQRKQYFTLIDNFKVIESG